jgi:phospholipase/carboxylesterase
MNHLPGNPHQGQPLLQAGEPLHRAKAATILAHGRGATADSMLALADELFLPGFAYLAPQAAGHSWYPNSFLAPLASNEPALSSALEVVSSILDNLKTAGIPAMRTLLLGFSQGACLSLEFAARNAQRFGGVAGLSGGLIGPEGTPRDYRGSLARTPIFLGCSDVDFHIPLIRVHQSAEVLRRLGGEVTERIYPGMGHTVNDDELEFVRGLMRSLAQG